VARLVQVGDYVGPGERLTAAYLETHLPEDWVVICNKELVAPDGTTKETDFIIVGGNVIYVVEEKHWSGRIDGDDRRWYPAFGPVRSPISVVLSSVRRMAGIIQDTVPGVRDRLTGIYVFGRVILSHPDVDLRVEEPRVAEVVLLLDGCEDSLESFDAAQPAGLSIGPYREEIIRTLESMHDRPDIPAKVNEYEVLESQGRSGLVRTVFARHEDGTERLLRIIERPETAVPETAQALQEVVLREYNSLRMLSDAGRAPLVDPYFSWGDNQYWVIPIHPLPGKSLAEDRLGGSPEKANALQAIEDGFVALSEVHASGIVHRDIRPETVHLSETGRVAFSDFTLARISGRMTLTGFVEVEPGTYRAPEARDDLSHAVSASDVYSLAASFAYWLSGEEPDERAGVTRILGGAADLVGDEVARVLDQCLATDPSVRPDAKTVANEIRVRIAAKAPDVRADVIAVDDLLDGQYRVIRELGRGATAVTYLALDDVSGQQFVLKRITNPEWVRRLAKNEFRALLDLSHPNLPRVFDVRPPGAPFHLKLEYVRGSSLRDLAASRRGDVPFAMRVADQLLNALTYLAEHHVIHRDLSPANILVPDEDSSPIKLIDFGVATDAPDAQTSVGTPRYRAPEIDRGGTWSENSDIYSLAVILIELLIGRLPYEVTDNTVAVKHIVLPPTPAEEALAGAGLLRVLFQAASPDRGVRYRTAAEFRDALAAALDALPAVVGTEVINPDVDLIRAAYRNSKIGNADNKGLDSVFAVETYVATRLDRELLPRIADGDFRLVVLTGNPGDGKTAFLQKLGEEFIRRGATILASGPAGWRIRLHNHEFRALFDASESDSGRSADDVLRQVLQPLEIGSHLNGGYTGLVAINDGRLLQFLDSGGDSVDPQIRTSLRQQLEHAADPSDGVVLVDLKRRSVVAPAGSSLGLFDDILKEFTRPERWAACVSCSARLECPIRFNALSFSDRSLRPATAVGLGTLLKATHLRRERRPTLRDLRSAIAYLITHDVGCADIHAERKRGVSPTAGGARYYFNAAFDGSGGPDLLLDEWATLDPGEVGEPRLDRYLFLRRSDSSELDRLFVGATDRPSLNPALGALDDSDRWVAALKHRYAFEGDASAPAELGLPSRERILPYRNLAMFIAALDGTADLAQLTGRLLLGISRADGVPPHLAERGLGLRMADSGGDFIVVKIFETTEFMVRVRPFASRFVEATPDSITLVHESGPALNVGLDLFEFLCRSADGLAAGPDEQRALAEDVERFKNELLARPAHEVLLSERGFRYHRVLSEAGHIKLVVT
jgi:serine/threonine protein kinase